MMTMIRWNPIAELEDMRRRMDTLLEKSSQLVDQQELPGSKWQPASEIYENETELVIEVDLPGLLQEEIQVRIEEHTLIIQGERKPGQDKSCATQRSERIYGPFCREFSLPGSFDEGRTVASCEHGVLQIRLLKKAGGTPKRIDVEVK